jgi:hypothetical protein
MALSAITAATAANSIANAAYTQTWNWALTGASNGHVIGETAAGTGTGALVQILGVSNGVTPLDVETTANTSQIHFGSGAAVGGWLSSPATSSAIAQISGGCQYVNGAWTARSTAAALITVNGAGGGSILFLASTGLTAGNTFTPTQAGAISGPAAGVFQMQIQASGVYCCPTNGFFAGGAHYGASGWIADATGSTSISTNIGGTIYFYSNTGLTSGTGFTPTQIGYIDSVGYHVGSDYRYKEDIHSLDSALPAIMKLRPVQFRWKIGLDSDTEHIGLLAHEVQRAIPSAVDIDKDLMREDDGGIRPQSLNYAEIVAVLCKAMQELSDKVETLEKTWPSKPKTDTSNLTQKTLSSSAAAAKRSRASTTR